MASDKCTTNKHRSLGTSEGATRLIIESPLLGQARTVVVDSVVVFVDVLVIDSKFCGEIVQLED